MRLHIDPSFCTLDSFMLTLENIKINIKIESPDEKLKSKLPAWEVSITV